jgi:hypothetical protein
MNFEIVKQNSLKNRQFLGCFLIQPQKSATFNKKWQKSADGIIVIPAYRAPRNCKISWVVPGEGDQRSWWRG